MKGREAGKAKRRHRIRITQGWTKGDADTCRDAELAAKGYIKPEVTLGRPPRMGAEVLADRHAWQEAEAEKEKVHGHDLDGYARALATVKHDFDPGGPKVTIGPGGDK